VIIILKQVGIRFRKTANYVTRVTSP